MATLLERIQQKKGVQQTTPTKSPGLLRSLGQEIAEPFAKLGATTERTLSSLLLGKNVSSGVDFSKNVLGKKVEPAKSAKELIGAGLEAGSYFIPVGAGVKAGATALKVGVPRAIPTLGTLGKLAGAGAVSGAMSGSGQALQEPTTSLSSLLGKTATGATIGAVAAPLIGTAAQAGGRLAQKAISKLPEPTTAPVAPVQAPRLPKTPQPPQPQVAQPSIVSRAKQLEQRVQAPKISKELEDIGFQKNVQNLITKADDQVKTDMIDLLKRAEQKDLSKLQNQPIFKLGQDFMESLKVLSSEAKKEGQKIQKIVSKSPNTVIDLDSARNKFLRELNKQGASLGNDGKIVFGPRISNTADQKILQETYDFVSQPQGVLDVYRKNQSLFDALKLGKANNELSLAENLTKKIRTEMKKAVETKLPVGEAQKRFAQIQTIVEPINKLLGTNYTPEEIATTKASEIIGRLLNRNAGRPTELLRQVIRESAKLQGKNPDKAWSDFLRKVEFTDVLEDVFGIAPSRSFKSQTEGAAKVASDLALDFVPYGATIRNVGKGLFGREKPLKQEQIKALKRLLNVK